MIYSSWKPMLRYASTAVLVIQRHLGADSLQRWLTDQGYRTERSASRAGFRVLSITTFGASQPTER